MALVISTDINCDGADCSAWTEGTAGPRVNAQAARRTAAAAGWKRRRIDGHQVDLCPNCAAKASPTIAAPIRGNPFAEAAIVDAVAFIQQQDPRYKAALQHTAESRRAAADGDQV